jgi:hypothetical protein
MKFLFVFLLFALATVSADTEQPPYSGTIFIAPDIITSEDPTAFAALKKSGRQKRTMYDRRANGWVVHQAHLFTASFKVAEKSSRKSKIEIQVNPEFTSEEAEKEARYYSEVIGRLPASLREHVETVWIHRGNNDYGGGNNNLLIHTGRTADYLRAGILEETFVHEATHTSLDEFHANDKDWLKAQRNDPGFISSYAQKHPLREDLAETFLLYFALSYKEDRLPEKMKTLIQKTIPNRIKYLDSIDFDPYPVAPKKKDL